MGNSQSVRKINYEDVQYVIKNAQDYILINTLNESDQECLIPNTVSFQKEELLINKLLKIGNKNVKIIIYGKHCNDEKIDVKYTQLTSLGFYNVFMYTGGLFEWLMLQDIYGDKEFPTTKKEIDFLKYKQNKILNIPLLEY
jgi:hypothetical protein